MNRDSGREVRVNIPFSAQAVFHPVDRDPIAMIESQNHFRIPELIPMRREKMAASPFAFFRGTALLMAHDLSCQAQSGIHVTICGDAHIGNFGFYASPERRLIFDLNDFDEAAPGPWEWDLKRLVTSIILSGHDLGFTEKKIHEAVLQTAAFYRKGLDLLSDMTSLERYFIIGDEELFLKSFSEASREEFEKIIRKAKKRTSSQVISKMTETDQFGRRIFIESPPITTHLDSSLIDEVELYFHHYLKTVRPDIELLLSQHVLTDIARRVVGVGSIGTRCYLLVLTCEDESHLVLQIKQANESAISQYSRKNFTTPDTMTHGLGNGYRVVSHQQILQAASDPFLGYFSTEDGLDFYVRQFRDMKGTVDLSELDFETFKQYVINCGISLARAHVQSPYANWINGYLGDSDGFDQAVLSWCLAYSEQVYRDYEAYRNSLKMP
jgi:uncharacterized protein (DUF2252 family)